NAFSPNEDHENDKLKIYINAIQCVTDFKLVIYNRWGEKIFETTDPAFEWAGIYNRGILRNTEMPGTEVFAYRMKATLITGEEVVRKGNVSLIR
ncbi:MAG: T9SS type B sorting domain-containing protein, partial [Bacteroidetes bacterium]